jgi:hypothetical protein
VPGKTVATACRDCSEAYVCAYQDTSHATHGSVTTDNKKKIYALFDSPLCFADPIVHVMRKLIGYIPVWRVPARIYGLLYSFE